MIAFSKLHTLKPSERGEILPDALQTPDAGYRLHMHSSLNPWVHRGVEFRPMTQALRREPQEFVQNLQPEAEV